MCRQGGYYEQAAYLAKKHGETDLVVDILIEDSKNYSEALDFIWGQDPEIVRFSTSIHGHQLTYLGLSMHAKIRQSSH